MMKLTNGMLECKQCNASADQLRSYYFCFRLFVFFDLITSIIHIEANNFIQSLMTIRFM